MKIKTMPFDAAEYLDTSEAQAEYLRVSFETGDSADIPEAIGTVAHARGMTQIAREAGVGRESLYKSLNEYCNPEFSTILRVVRSLGLNLTITPAYDHA